MSLHESIKLFSPLLVPLIVVCAGICWQAFLPLPLPILFCLFMLTTGIVWNLVKNKADSAARLVALAATFFGSAWLVEYDTTAFNAQRQHRSPVAIEATIIDRSWHPSTPHPYHYSMTVTPAIPARNALQAPISLTCYAQNACWWKVGDTVRINNPRISGTPSLTFDGGPTFAHYMAKENSAASLFVNRPWTRIISRPGISLSRMINRTRQRIYTSLFFRLSRPTFTFFSSIFLGLKTFAPVDAVKEQFGYWGLAHYLARSGLHIVLFIVIWSFILQAVPLSYAHKNWLLLAITLFYYLLSYSSISFLRALFIFVLFQVGKLIRSVPLAFCHLLTIVGISILLINPLQLFFLDFQLSFFITLALTLSPLFIAPRPYKIQ